VTEAVRDYLRFHLADGVGAITFRKLMDAFGDMESLLRAGPQGWKRVDGVSTRRAEAVTAVTAERLDEEFAAAERAGASIHCWADAAYPAALKTIYDLPPVFYVRGRLATADAVAFGIVGARRCSHYGLEQSRRFGQLLARAGFTVVSGGARGIDTAAHRGALEAGGRTIAVMGCGLGKTYPPENAELFERIVAEARGALISELPMGVGIKGENFPKRNRIISGLSLGVLVVEAARRSGALITADQATEQGRIVFALPGRVDSPMSQGANALIRQGATLVQDLDDILDALGTVGETMTPQAEELDQPIHLPNLTETEKALLGQLADGPVGLDELTRATGLDGAKVTATMTVLLLKGAVTQQPGNVFVKKSWAWG